MADTTYIPKTYRKDGGDTFVVASGGQILVEPGGSVMGGNPSGAADYFVDLNVSATGDGSMGSPFATIAEAITASNLSIGLTANRWWARRNRIFIMGDGITESLTVWPEKCDMIGIGTDLHPFPRITGAHTCAVAKVGLRLINLGFVASGAGAALNFVAGCHGLQILGCYFQASAAGNTLAMTIADSAHVKIAGCRIVTSAGAITTSIFATAVNITGTASIHDLNVLDNNIFATAGIAVANGTCHGSLIKDNVIRVVGGLCINDDSDDIACVNNRFISSNASLAETSFCDWNRLLAVGNKCVSNTAMNADIPTIVVLTS